MKRVGGGAVPQAARTRGASPRTFVAIDFETADRYRDSACSVALIRVEGGRISERVTQLIRPPRRQFEFSGLHGITWTMVANEPTFAQAWPRLEPVLRGAEFLVAHNAGFDRSVLNACCAAAHIEPPPLEFKCTVQMARQVWSLPSARLPDVCAFLDIPLRHHDAASDAEACARIFLAAQAMLAGG
jgi:DNA polymerase III subunit epsilon